MVVLKFLFGLIIHLDFVLLFLMLGGLVCHIFRCPKWGHRLIIGSLVPFLIISLTPLSRVVVMTLEDRFPRMTQVPQDTKGMILLGGSIAQKETEERGFPVYNLAGSRLLEFVALALENPHLKLVFTGTPMEVQAAKEVFDRFKLTQRVTFEKESLNTYDNAYRTAALLKPKSYEKWILVTSAYHMPRAMGLFKGAGFLISAWPVDYHTSGKVNKNTLCSILDRQSWLAWRSSALEWAGLINNYLEGSSPFLYPSSEDFVTTEISPLKKA
jgi:uncharacterized SAM-binding protein YcdF (DUF218 family)